MSQVEPDLGVAQGTAASKKKKKKKLDRVMSTLKRKSRQGRAQQQNSFAALQLLHDPQVRSRPPGCRGLGLLPCSGARSTASPLCACCAPPDAACAACVCREGLAGMAAP